MHIDHIGNLGLFTHANAYVNKAEFKWALYMAHACYTRENHGPSVKYSAVPGDTVAYRNSIEKLHRLEKEHHAMMIFGHDMEQFMSLKRAPEYYE